MKIGYKIVLAFGLFILMICAVGIILHHDNREMQAQFHEMKEDVVPGALAMRDTQVLLTQMVMEAREYSRKGDPVYAKKVRASADSIRESTDTHTDSDMRLNPEHSTVAFDIEDKADELIDLCSNLIALRDSGIANEYLYAEKDAIEQKRHELNEILDRHVGEHLDELAAAEIEIQNLTSQNSLVMIGGIGLILVSALIIFFLVGRTVVAPINKLKRGAEAIGSGNYSHRLDIGTKDELGELAESFNVMSEKIYESHATLEQKVEERTNELETIIESAPVGIMLIDSETREIVKVNRNAVKMTGRTNDELIGKRCHEFVCTAEEGKCPILDLGQEVDNSEQALLNADGSEVPVLKSVVRTTIEGRDYLLETFTDITDQKQAEEEVRKERDKANNYLDIAGAIIMALDTEGYVTLINKKGCEVLGYAEQEIIGKNWLDNFIPEEIRDEIKQIHSNSTHGEGLLAEENENPIINRDGEVRVIKWFNSILKNELGKITGVLSSGEDITERKQVEEEVKRLAMIVEQAVEGIAFADLDGTLQYVNKEWAVMHGYDSAKDLAGKHLSIFHTEEQLKNDVIPFNEETLRSGSNSGEIGHVRKDGTTFPTYMSTIIFKDEQDEPTAFVGFATDITDRKQAEQKLKSKMDELEEFNLAAVGRELKMIQLKEEVNRLREEKDKEAKYEIVK